MTEVAAAAGAFPLPVLAAPAADGAALGAAGDSFGAGATAGVAGDGEAALLTA